MHWIVRVARSAGLPNADSLEVGTRADPSEAWVGASAHCGVSEDELAEAIAGWFRLDVADFSEAESLASNLLPATVARDFKVFPLHHDDRYLSVAIADPCNVAAEQAVGFASGRIPVFRIAPPHRILEHVEATYAPDRAVESLMDRIDSDIEGDVAVVEEDEGPGPEVDMAALEDDDEEGSGPIVRLTNMILDDAVTKGASDIHLQPLPTGGVIRLRIDGVLRSGITVPLVVLARVISRIKIMSKLDISDKMRPQDGRTRIRIGGHKYDLRVSTVPVRGGEKAVIRILDPTGSGSLDDCGLPDREIERLRRILKHRDGILVVTGPTGSGKTTTMYGALREIATEDVNIMTVEDPVEYELVGLTQIQVDAKKGVTFHSALKAILRQDPDVIFVGEIRDQATAEMAAQASLTGHLVLATVHANDAVGSIRRFIDLGLDAGTIAETMRGALAQRLLRTFCEACVAPAGDSLDAKEADLAERYGVRPAKRAVGCELCGDSGYRGRRPIVELMVPGPDLLRMIADEDSHVDLTEQARREGMRLLVEGALDLVKAGLTSLAEVERVTGEDGAAPPPPLAEAEAAPAAETPAAESRAAAPPPPEPSPAAPAPVEPSPAQRAPEEPVAADSAPDESVAAESAPAGRPAAEEPARPASSGRVLPPPAMPSRSSSRAEPEPSAPAPAESTPDEVASAPDEGAAPPPSKPARERRAPAATAEEIAALAAAETAAELAALGGDDAAADTVESADASDPLAGPWTLTVEEEEKLEPPRVLVVDDDTTNRTMVRGILEKQGWVVQEAADGKDALIAIGMGQGLSLIVLDLGLPDIDGIDVLRAAKKNLASAGIPVIGLTGRTDKDTERLLLEEGADDYIRKPLDPSVFLMRAKAVVRRSGAA